MMNIGKGAGLNLNYRQHELVNCGDRRRYIASRYEKVLPSFSVALTNKPGKESTGFGELDINISKMVVS
jgi:hypothetical protein